MKFYKHKINLVERTKLLEGIVCQSISFTNVLSKMWNGVPKETTVSALVNCTKSNDASDSCVDVIELIDDLVQTPHLFNDQVTLPSFENIMKRIVGLNDRFDDQQVVSTEFSISYTMNGKTNVYNIELMEDLQERILFKINSPVDIQYTMKYMNGVVPYFYYIYYRIEVVENQHPTKRWTFTDAVKRVLQLAEPLYKGEEPRFKLNDAQAEKYANTYISETTMTSCTLREQLKHLRNFIHAEPRLGGYDENGVYQENWIFFDEYGGTKTSTLQGAMVAGLPCALINGALSVGSELVNLAIRQNEINVARQQENTTLFLNQIRIGAYGGRM